MTALESRFWTALRRLEAWHSDAVKAQSFTNSNTTHGKPGSVELKVTPYPHYSYWTNEWRKARDDVERETVISDLGEEWDQLGLSPSKKHSHRQRGVAWKVEIGTANLPAKNVARLYCVGLSTVYKYRAEYGSKSA
jgi:hypothetical protein